MIIAIGSDEATELTTALQAELRQRGHTVLPFGPLAPGDPDSDWPIVASRVAQAVARGQADQGIVCCWTGTGASIAANKVPGVRAALVHDAETARGARIWNHANVLALSLRATPIPIAREILDAWFATPTDSGEAASEWNQQQIARLAGLENAAKNAAHGPVTTNANE
jgi:ribose 5-phosphate isomerase B